MTSLTLTQASQLAEGDLDLLVRLTDGIETFLSQPQTHDSVRLGLAIGNFIRALAEPAHGLGTHTNGQQGTRCTHGS